MNACIRLFSLCAVSALALMLAGCASSGASARPVLYPNATLNRVGDSQGRLEANACMARAQASGLRASQTSNEVGRRAG
ncbi:MAG: glycine zipper family protein, partial [Polaromonas sp.]